MILPFSSLLLYLFIVSFKVLLTLTFVSVKSNLQSVKSIHTNSNPGDPGMLYTEGFHIFLFPVTCHQRIKIIYYLTCCLGHFE